MAVPLYTPRVNNNDDAVRFTYQFVTPGAFIRKGEPVADVETDKATFTVEAEEEGYLLGFNSQVGETIDVGSVLAWIGATADEPVPAAKSSQSTQVSSVNGVTPGSSPSLKATILLAQYGLKQGDVRASGERLSAADVEQHIAEHGLTLRSPERTAAERPAVQPSEPGKRVDLTAPERGVLQTVSWQKSEAVPAYLQLAFDPAPWEQRAREFQKHYRLLMSPLLSLFGWHLVRLAADEPRINATVSGKQKHVYDDVNFGFTVQSGSSLFVVVLRQAQKLSAIDFVQKLGELQRSAMRGKLRPDETSGATIGFSSMARWPVTGHMPVLLPQTSLMIAHAASAPGHGTSIGATYDHRLLTGFDIVQLLQKLTTPPAIDLSATPS